MNSKTKYMIPAFAAVFALMFVAASPYVMAESGDRESWKDGAKWNGEKYTKKGYHGHKAVLVEEFVGTIPVPEEKNEETFKLLKSQITVSLGQAVDVAESNGFTDAMKANIGIAKDSEGNKYVVWAIASMDRDSELETMTANIFVVDAGNVENFATVTKSFDRSEMKEKMNGDKSLMSLQRFSPSASDGEIDPVRAQFQDLVQQLRDAYENGDTETAESIKGQLQELRQGFISPGRS